MDFSKDGDDDDVDDDDDDYDKCVLLVRLFEECYIILWYRWGT